jgi:hypothetical protein
MVVKGPGLTTLMVSKFIRSDGAKTYLITRFKEKRILAIQIKEFYGSPADELPAARAV